MRKKRVAISTSGAMYVYGSVQGQVKELLVNTGSDAALMSTKVYLGIPAQEKRACGTVLTQADG